MKAEEIIDLIDKYWKFDNNQQHASNWHDKQDLLELFRKSTAQPQPKLSAREYYDKRISEDSTIGTVQLMEEYRNQPIEKLEPQDIINAREAAYKKAGHNAYFGNGFEMGVQFGLKYNQPIEVKHPRTEQEEADRLVKLQFPISCYKECISMLQLRGLSTEFEEKVLTILKGK